MTTKPVTVTKTQVEAAKKFGASKVANETSIAKLRSAIGAKMLSRFNLHFEESKKEKAAATKTVREFRTAFENGMGSAQSPEARAWNATSKDALSRILKAERLAHSHGDRQVNVETDKGKNGRKLKDVLSVPAASRFAATFNHDIDSPESKMILEMVGETLKGSNKDRTISDYEASKIFGKMSEAMSEKKSTDDILHEKTVAIQEWLSKLNEDRHCNKPIDWLVDWAKEMAKDHSKEIQAKRVNPNKQKD